MKFASTLSMLSFERKGSSGPLIVFLHWLGGGAQTWREVSTGLAARGAQCVAMDLPGFGQAASVAGYSITAMADQVAETLRSLRPELTAATASEPWIIAGHSMGGSVAALIARRALDGEAGLERLRGVLLVSPSPPGPEPMSDTKRADMLKSLGAFSEDPEDDRKPAAKFVDDNTGKLELPKSVRERAIHGVLGMNRGAFRMWLEHGSREDLRGTIGVVDLPTLVFAGTEDAALGPDAQREHTLPSFPQAELITLDATGHLAPLERPGVLVEYLTTFLTGLKLPLLTPVSHPGPLTEGLMHSRFTSPKSLDVMARRLDASENWNTQPQTFTVAEFRTLRALAATVVPDAGFDLAASIDAQLAANKGDGWRFAKLPSDPDAWRRGLASLDHAAMDAQGVNFLAIYPEQQHTLLQQAADGKLGKGLLGSLHLGSGASVYDAQQMKQWVEDARSEFTRRYMGDPRTMSRVGYTGFADDFGFTQITLGQSETPEPSL